MVVGGVGTGAGSGVGTLCLGEGVTDEGCRWCVGVRGCWSFLYVTGRYFLWCP